MYKVIKASDVCSVKVLVIEMEWGEGCIEGVRSVGLIPCSSVMSLQTHLPSGGIILQNTPPHNWALSLAPHTLVLDALNLNLIYKNIKYFLFQNEHNCF